MNKKTRYFRQIQVITMGCLLAFGGITTSCKKERPLKDCITFEEMQDPTADTLSDWSKVGAGLQASLVSIDKSFPKSVAPEVEQILSNQLTGWKGERLSAQLLLWSAEDIKQVECEFSDFKSEGGTLPASMAQARFVRYVMTDEFAAGCGQRKPEDFAASLAPDMLDSLDCFDMKGKTVRPVWLTIDIPATATAGIYSGKLNVYARNNETKVFDIKIEVLEQVLPAPAEWVYHLDLWQHPSAVARAQNLELWSDAHFEAMKPLMKMLANAGQKVITANVNKDPWNNQCYDAYADMISWTKNTDGSWTYDYTIFDKWVKFMMNQGINKMINCYSMLSWNNELHYKDMATGQMVTINPKAGSKEFNEVWTAFLSDFTKHMKDNNWLSITNIAMDERSPLEMEATVKLLTQVSPELGIALADNHKSYKKYPQIKDMCVGIDCKVDSMDIVNRRAKGLITTYYVCCADKFPNQFTFSASAEAVYAGWYAVAGGYDGFLRWAYNSWTEKPLIDSRFKTWPAGDTYIVYPNGRSSIRFERLIEGIQDAEKIRIIREKLTKENTPEAIEKLVKLENEISKFNTANPEKNWNETLNHAKNLLNKLM